MPSPKRWFPVSHDLFSDPEIWTLVEAHGDRSLFVWLWLLSRLDQQQNTLTLRQQDLSPLAHALHVRLRTVQGALTYALDRGWLCCPAYLPHQPLTFPLTLSASNYWRYHRKQTDQPQETKSVRSAPQEMAPISDTVRRILANA